MFCFFFFCILNFLITNRGIKEEKPPKEDDDMFGTEEHDEAMFMDVDCDHLHGQVCMNIFRIFYVHWLIFFCHFDIGSRSTKDFRQVGQACPSRIGSKERSSHFPTTGYWLLHRQTDERYAWRSNRDSSHYENIWSHQAAKQHLLPCPWLCSLLLCHYSTSIYGKIPLFNPLLILLKLNFIFSYSQKWLNHSKRP